MLILVDVIFYVHIHEQFWLTLLANFFNEQEVVWPGTRTWCRAGHPGAS